MGSQPVGPLHRSSLRSSFRTRGPSSPLGFLQQTDGWRTDSGRLLINTSRFTKTHRVLSQEDGAVLML